MSLGWPISLSPRTPRNWYSRCSAWPGVTGGEGGSGIRECESGGFACGNGNSVWADAPTCEMPESWAEFWGRCVRAWKRAPGLATGEVSRGAERGSDEKIRNRRKKARFLAGDHGKRFRSTLRARAQEFGRLRIVWSDSYRERRSPKTGRRSTQILGYFVFSFPSCAWERAFPRSCASSPLRAAEVKLRQQSHSQVELGNERVERGGCGGRTRNGVFPKRRSI